MPGGIWIFHKNGYHFSPLLPLVLDINRFQGGFERLLKAAAGGTRPGSADDEGLQGRPALANQKLQDPIVLPQIMPSA